MLEEYIKDILHALKSARAIDMCVILTGDHVLYSEFDHAREAVSDLIVDEPEFKVYRWSGDGFALVGYPSGASSFSFLRA